VLSSDIPVHNAPRITIRELGTCLLLYFRTIIQNAAMSTVHSFIWTYVFIPLGKLGVGFLGCVVILAFTF
jgi:hypothetical protein